MKQLQQRNNELSYRIQEVQKEKNKLMNYSDLLEQVNQNANDKIIEQQQEIQRLTKEIELCKEVEAKQDEIINNLKKEIVIQEQIKEIQGKIANQEEIVRDLEFDEHMKNMSIKAYQFIEERDKNIIKGEQNG